MNQSFGEGSKSLYSAHFIFSLPTTLTHIKLIIFLSNKIWTFTFLDVISRWFSYYLEWCNCHILEFFGPLLYTANIDIVVVYYSLVFDVCPGGLPRCIFLIELALIRFWRWKFRTVWWTGSLALVTTPYTFLFVAQFECCALGRFIVHTSYYPSNMSISKVYNYFTFLQVYFILY